MARCSGHTTLARIASRSPYCAFECSSPPLCVCVGISETWFSPAPEGRCAVNSPSTLLVSAGCSSHERRSVGFNSQHSSRSHADSPFYILVGVHYANSLPESNWTVAFSRCFFFFKSFFALLSGTSSIAVAFSEPY